MKRRYFIWIMLSCALTSVLLAGSAVYRLTYPDESVPYKGIGVPVVAHHNPTPTPSTTTPSMQVTPKTAHDGFAMPTNYEAQDIFNYLLWEHRPVSANFPHGTDFPSPAPASFLGFSDTSQGVSHWYIIAVYKTTIDATQDYQAMQPSSSDVLFVTARCMLIGDKTASGSMTVHYENLLTDACN